VRSKKNVGAVKVRPSNEGRDLLLARDQKSEKFSQERQRKRPEKKKSNSKRVGISTREKRKNDWGEGGGKGARYKNSIREKKSEWKRDGRDLQRH